MCFGLSQKHTLLPNNLYIGLRPINKMALTLTIDFDPEMQLKELSPNSILGMLKQIKKEIGTLDETFLRNC